MTDFATFKELVEVEKKTRENCNEKIEQNRQENQKIHRTIREKLTDLAVDI